MTERALCVVLHDVAPATWDGCLRVLDAIDAVAPLPLTLLVVPCYHGSASHPGFERQINERLMRGNELALHGYTHLDHMPLRNPAAWLQRRIYTAGEGEFAALSVVEARRRLEAGRRWFAERGWPVDGFVPPAWLLSPGSWQALRESSFMYTSTLRHIHLLSGGHARLGCQGLVYSTRSALRRRMSAIWNRLLFSRQGDAPLMRFELHPWDADYPAVRQNWQRLLKQALETRTPMTTADFVNSWVVTSCAASTSSARTGVGA